MDTSYKSLFFYLQIFVLGVFASSSAFAQTFTDSKFVAEAVGGTGAGVTSLAFGPGGIMYAIEKRGRVMVFTPDGTGGYNSPTVFADLRSNVFASQESGLLGLALDPDFAATRLMYLFYTTQLDQRVVRIQASASYTVMTGVESLILGGLPRDSAIHKGGDIEFDPSDSLYLYVALGDDANIGEAQNLNAYNGKVLKVDKNTGLGAPDNPFVVAGDTASVRARVWSLGHRNPFRIDAHASGPNDVIFISENGNQTDRFSRVEKGSNGAWNTQGDNGGFLNPPNTGPGTGEHKVLATLPPSIVGIVLLEGGPFSAAESQGDIVAYVAQWQGNISRWRLSGANLDTATSVVIDNGAPFMNGNFSSGIDLVIGPDEWMYYPQTGNDESIGTHYMINRIKVQGANAPIANFSTAPSPATGNAPLVINFTDNSQALNGASIASRDWQFGDGQTSTLRNPQHTFQNPGTYITTLSVVDSNGLRSSSQLTVTSIGTVSCDDLSSVPVTPDVEYSDVQNIWNNSCIGCHATATPAAGLDLSGDSLTNLLNVESNQVPSVFQVVPFRSDVSYLFEKINCVAPQFGGRMPVSSAISLSNQALVRDWINQGARPTASSDEICYPLKIKGSGRVAVICL